MKFEIQSVISVEENVGFRVIGCLVSDTEEEKNNILPELCSSMAELLKCYSKNVQAEISTNKREWGSERTIVYRAISLPELAFVLKQFNKSFTFKTNVVLSETAKLYPEDIKEIFRFQLECFKQQNDL